MSRRKYLTGWCLAVMIAMLPVSAAAYTQYGIVVAVASGDSITISDAAGTLHEVRLMGIDAPESGQPFGEAAKQHLSQSIYGKQVSVEYQKRDRRSRIVGKVKLGGMDVNLEQVRLGQAWNRAVRGDNESDQLRADRAAYAEAAEEARRTRRGLWNDTAPIPPWKWRRGER